MYPASPIAPSASAAETTFRWLAQPYALLDESAAQFGDTFTLQFTHFGTHVIVTHPEDVRRVFAADRDVLCAGRGNLPLGPILGTRSILLLDGAAHAAERAMLQVAMRAGATHQHARIAADEAERALGDWGRRQAIDVHAATLAVSRAVILRAVCGLEGAALDDVTQGIITLMRVVGTNASFADPHADGPLERRLQAALASTHGALASHIAHRRAHPPEDGASTLVDGLIAAGLPDTAIGHHLLTMILAGHETTAAALSWAIVCLATNPDVHEQLDGALRDAGALPPERLAQAPYLQAVALETLRLHPPIPVVSREAQRPFAIRSGLVPAGSFVTPCAYLAHRRAASFSEPSRFHPDRFRDARFAPHVLFPFGGGARRCIGMGLALLEIAVVLGVWARGRRFTLAGTPRPMRRSVTIIPGGRWRLTVEDA